MKKYVFKTFRKRALVGLIDLVGAILLSPIKLFRRATDPKKILVVRLDQVGDVIQTLPFFEKLRAKYPRAHIAALTVEGTAFLFRGNQNIGAVHTLSGSWFYQGNKPAFAEVFTLVRDLRKAAFDLAFDLRGDLRNLLLLYFSGARQICGYDCAGGGFLLDCKRDYDREEHEIDKNLKLIDEKTHGAMQMDFFVPEEAKIKARELMQEGKKRIVIHPFAGTKAKLWGFEKYAALIARICEGREDVRVYVAGSANEKDFERHFAFGERVVNAIGLDFFVSIELIRQSDLFIGNDSALQYFAAYSGVKTCVIYGYNANHLRWKPKVIEENLETFSKEVKCGPCELRECNQKQHECMDIITVDEVYGRIRKWL